MPFFQDNTPYLFPPEMFAPAEYLERGQQALDAGQVNLRGVIPWRLQNIVRRFGLTPEQQAEVDRDGLTDALGFTLQMPDGTYVVFYNKRLPDTLRQVVIDHELGHVGSWNATHDGS